MKLVSDEKLQGIAIGLRFGMENINRDIESKLQEVLEELARRRRKLQTTEIRLL